MLQAEYRAAFLFLGKHRKLIFWVVAGFFLTVLVSGVGCYLAFSQDPALLEQLMRWVGELLDSKGIVDETGQMNPFLLFFANFMAAVLPILYGMIPFLYLPVLSLLLNSWMIGVVGAAALCLGMPPAALVASLVPHGIFELPALLIAASLGLLLCHSLVRRILRRPEPGFVALLSDLVRVLVLIVVPLLVVAAVIESYVTGAIASLFL